MPTNTRQQPTPTPESVPDAWLHAGRLAADDAGKALLGFADAMRRTCRTEERGRETKIAADAALHESISAALAPTGIPVFSEEGCTTPPDTEQWCWIIDPLDGSANFQRGISLCAVSIALCQGTSPRAGFVFDLHTQRLVCGGSLTGFPSDPILQCSKTQSVDRAMICTGIPARLQNNPQSLAAFSSIFDQFFKVRMLGSAVQALLHLATGKTDAYYESNIMFWDVVAGLAIAQAAGCPYACLPGSRAGSFRILATNPAIFDACHALLMTAPSPHATKATPD